MRLARLIGVAAMAACGFGAQAEDVAAGADPAPERLYSIDALEASCDGGVLTVTARATADSMGWTQTRLHQTEASDDTVTFEAVGLRPEMSAQALESVRLASQVNARKGVAHVHVEAKTNALDAAVVPAC